jgi:hypothetical protein
MESNSLHAMLTERVCSACNWPDEQRHGLLDCIHQRFGDGVVAILIYGSYLRGKRDTLLDFYVLLEDYAAMRSGWQALLCWMLPPNVYQARHGRPPQDARAKYAVMTLGRFEHAMRHDFHSYFWARFAQPSGLLYCRDQAVQQRVVAAIGAAANTFVRRVVPRLPDRFTAADLVSCGLSMTYRCELRSEPAGHAQTLYGHDPAYYQAIVGLLAEAGLDYRAGGQVGHYLNESTTAARRMAALRWAMRRVLGKVLSVLRLLKATLTFAGGFDYLLWKIGRHSGIRIEPTSRQSKYPLIFGWSLLWRLYRRGAFR